jgi:hypothetical protein
MEALADPADVQPEPEPVRSAAPKVERTQTPMPDPPVSNGRLPRTVGEAVGRPQAETMYFPENPWPPAPTTSIGPPMPRKEPHVYFPRLSARFHSITQPRLAWSHWGYPEQYIEPPLGATVYAPVEVQIANGQAAQMVLYDYDFYDTGKDAATLNTRGRRQLAKIALLASRTPHPIIVEYLADRDELNELRRQHVVEELQKLSIEVPEIRVIVGQPPLTVLSGDDALAIIQGLLRRTASGTGTGASGGDSNVPSFLGIGGASNQGGS